MVGSYGTHRREELDLDGMIILNWIVTEWVVEM